MKKLINATALLILVSSCQSVKMVKPDIYGSISLDLGAEVTVSETTKAANPETVDDYTVFIAGENIEGGSMSFIYKDFQPVTLKLGTYTVSAQNATSVEAETGNGCKRLYGSQEVTLSESNLNPTVAFTCTVANSLVTVVFDQSAIDYVTNLKVELTGGDSNRTVSVTESNTEVWFNPSTVSYKITGRIESVNKDINITGSKTLAAKNHLKLKVSVNLDNGQIGVVPTITLDTTIDTAEEKNETFNPYE